MPILETTIATAVIAAAGVKLVMSALKSREARGRKLVADSIQEIHDGLCSIGATKFDERVAPAKRRGAYFFSRREGIRAAHAYFDITEEDGSEFELMVTVDKTVVGSELPESLHLRPKSAVTRGIAAVRAEATLPDEVTLTGEMFELLRALIPTTHARLEELDAFPNVDVDRFRIWKHRVDVNVRFRPHRRSSSALKWDLNELATLADIDHVARLMWEACALASYDRPALAMLSDAVTGSRPGGELRASALRVMVERAPQAPSTLGAWAEVVEGGNLLDLLVCHEVAPTRLERDLPYHTLLSLLQTLSDRPHAEQDAFSKLIVRRLGYDAFVASSVSPDTMLRLFTRAYEEDLLEDDELSDAFSRVVGSTSLLRDLDALAGVIADLRWAQGARIVCHAKLELASRIGDVPFLNMLEAIPVADLTTAREDEIEAALLALVTPRPRTSIENTARVLSLLATIGGGRTIEALRAHHAHIAVPRESGVSARQVAQDLEDRLGGVHGRGGLSVARGDGQSGGLSQADGEAGSIELSVPDPEGDGG